MNSKISSAFILTVSLWLFLATFNLLYSRSVEKINFNWKFIEKDIPEAKVENYNDADWRTLHLPHDWAFEGGYSVKGAQKEYGGYAGGGIGWYRKELVLNKKQLQNKKIFVDFEAVYMNSEVWINGNYLGKRPYGYISFSYDITPYLKVGINKMAVRVDNSLEPSARWYHGCGIYGNVTLTTVEKVHFKQWSTFVSSKVSNYKAQISLKSEIEGTLNSNMQVVYTVHDTLGNIVGKCVGVNGEISLDNPQLWDIENPYLYKLTARIIQKNKLIDEIQIPFGIRTVEWKIQTGFWLNGKNVKLQGVCEHLEGGPIGAAWTEKLIRWKIKLLKDMGVNAIRTAHNPQLPNFYKICDEMGMLVMDEIFDGWERKAQFDYGQQAFVNWWERDLRDFVRRDRNHPSIIAYSVGNETKGAVAKDLVRVCREEDPTRWVTSGHSGSEEMDILGVNGHSERKTFIDTFTPTTQAFVGTETPHTWQVRGFYRTKTWYRDGATNKVQAPFEIPDLTPTEIFTYDWISPERRENRKQIFNSSYDNATVRLTARHNIEFLRDLPWYSGSFRWTGFDYLGEAGYVHGGWPFRAFMGGVIDMAGFPKDHYYLYQAEWTSKDMMHILPHWTHPYMSIGTEIPVWVYSNAEEVELFLNGKSLGKKSKSTKALEMQFEWLVPWISGEIEAVAYRNGKEILRSKQVTSGAPAKLKVESDTKNLLTDGDDIAIVTLTQNDDKGVLYPYGENNIYIKVLGNAVIASLENGNPVDTTCNVGVNSKKAFFGLLRAFVKSTTDNGDVSILAATISGDKALKISDKISIDVQEIALRGNLQKRNISTYYSTDNSAPTKQSKKYTAPFQVSDGTTVKAIVYDNDNVLAEMQERFVVGEGLYWGKPGEAITIESGEKASKATLKNATVRNIDGIEAVQYKPTGGSISWYQENDGTESTVMMLVKYALNSKSEFSVLELYNNGKLIQEVKFPTTGSISHWKKVTVPLTLFSGANQIELRSSSGDAPFIEFMEIKH